MRYAMLACVGVACVAGPAWSCVEPNPTPPPTFWTRYDGFNPTNGHEFTIGLEVSLFGTQGADVACGCGLNLEVTDGTALPSGIELKGAGVYIVNKVTNEIRPVPEFVFDANQTTTDGLTALSPGGTWFGFFDPAVNLSPPPLGPNEVYKLLFNVSIDPGLGVVELAGRVGSGKANPDGSPMAGNFFVYAPQNNIFWIPAPSTAVVAGLGLLATLRRSRR